MHLLLLDRRRRVCSLVLHRRLLRHSPDSRQRNEKGADAETPVHGQLSFATLAQGIDTPGHGSARGLECLVAADENGRAACAVRLGADEPVRETLPERVVGAVEDVQENRPCGEAALLKVNVLDQAPRHAVILPQLKRVSASPDGHSRDENDGPAETRTIGAIEPWDVEDKADEQTAEHLGNPVEGRVERARADVEGETVDVILLVAVEDVGREEEGNHANYTPPADGADGHLGGAPDTALLRLNGAVQLRKADARRRTQEQAQHPAEEHDNHKGDVGRVGDGAGFVVVVEGKGHEGADAAAQVEDDPKCGDGAALLRLGDVRGHDGALDDPEEGSAHTKNTS